MAVGTKINDALYYDERSAGGIVYKTNDDKVTWLVVKTSASKYHKNPENRYVHKFPKGHLRKGEVLKAAALREVEEEGKVKSKIIAKIGSNDYIIWDRETRKKIIKKVTFFLMEYLGESSLKYFDQEIIFEQKWLPFKEATDILAFDSEKILLRKAKIKLEEILKEKK